DSAVSPGDEVVLIGAQQGERLTAEDWARTLDTISYEVVTRIGRRVPRLYRAGKGTDGELAESPTGNHPPGR
ncbi:MAG TPA: alanine racemase C-terminal domain-containing protein, partial [Acidimicrobiales bacterium]|nr:alanine racemase C-terminal domain-containing protein [Acidimicrobiales bacterium]